jgi:diphthamide synthase (EF-2-diphthine--ammonia ligase)
MVEHMISTGLEAYVSSVDLKKLPMHFVGRKWSRDLISEFPEDSDPSGENGEIHTVVVGGTMFREPIPVRVGEIIERNGFAYADIIPMN